jgi:hypothetical protein
MSGVYYRASQPRARNGQFLPYEPGSRNHPPASAHEPPQAPPNLIVHRDAHLPPITHGVGGITSGPGARSFAPLPEPAPAQPPRRRPYATND